MVIWSGNSNDCKFVGIYLNFLSSYETVNVLDGSFLSGKSAVYEVEMVGNILGDVDGV